MDILDFFSYLVKLLNRQISMGRTPLPTHEIEDIKKQVTALDTKNASNDVKNIDIKVDDLKQDIEVSYDNKLQVEKLIIENDSIEVDSDDYGLSVSAIGKENIEPNEREIEETVSALTDILKKPIRKKAKSSTKRPEDIIKEAEKADEEPFSIRAEKIKEIFKNLRNKPKTEMVYFVMYDIESNRIRPKVAKYLEQKGLQRIQKSIFLGQTKQSEYETIRRVLTQLQKSYANDDSIIIVPVPEDLLKTMYLIGRDVDFEITLNRKVTVFI